MLVSSCPVRDHRSSIGLRRPLVRGQAASDHRLPGPDDPTQSGRGRYGPGFGKRAAARSVDLLTDDVSSLTRLQAIAKCVRCGLHSRHLLDERREFNPSLKDGQCERGRVKPAQDRKRVGAEMHL